MVIWQDIEGVQIRHKIKCVTKVNKPARHRIIKDCGDIPVANINNVTGLTEMVFNTRGRAYATRNDIRFQRARYQERRNALLA